MQPTTESPSGLKIIAGWLLQQISLVLVPTRFLLVDKNVVIFNSLLHRLQDGSVRSPQQMRNDVILPLALRSDRTLAGEISAFTDVNLNIVGFGTSDANGEVEITYTRLTPSVDIMLAGTILGEISDPLTVTWENGSVLIPAGLKAESIENLTPFAAESKRIEKAIREINKSLEDKLWLDDSHLDSKHGQKVFSHERHAVIELMHLLNGTSNGGSGDDKCGGIDRIVLRYTGDVTVNIAVYLKDELLTSFTVVSVGDPIEILETMAEGGRLHPEISLMVDGVEVEQNHTSCSKPIDIGDVHGDFTISDLDKILGKSKGKDAGASDEALAAAIAAIDALVNADRILAQTLLIDVSGLDLGDTLHQDHVIRELQKSQDELDKGDIDRNAGDPDKAIQHYRKAWDHAGHAAKEALKPAKSKRKGKKK